MQDFNWHLIYLTRERMNKLKRKVSKVLEICPVTEKVGGLAPHLKALRFEMVGARVDPETKELLLICKAKE